MSDFEDDFEDNSSQVSSMTDGSMGYQNDDDCFSDEEPKTLQEFIQDYRKLCFKNWIHRTSDLLEFCKTYKYAQFMQLNSMKTLLTPKYIEPMDTTDYSSYDQLRKDKFEKALLSRRIRGPLHGIGQTTQKITIETPDTRKLRRVLLDSPDLFKDDAHQDIMDYILAAEANGGKVKVSWCLSSSDEDELDEEMRDGQLFPVSPTILRLSERFRNRVLAFNDKEMFYEQDKRFSTQTFCEIVNMYNTDMVTFDHKTKEYDFGDLHNCRCPLASVPFLYTYNNMHKYHKKQLEIGLKNDAVLNPNGVSYINSEKLDGNQLPALLCMQYREEYGLYGPSHELLDHWKDLDDDDRNKCLENLLNKHLQLELGYSFDMAPKLEQFHSMDYLNRFFAQLDSQIIKLTYDDNNKVKDIDIQKQFDFMKSLPEKIAFCKNDKKCLRNQQTIASYFTNSLFKRRYDGVGFYPTNLPKGFLNLYTGLELLPLKPNLINEENNQKVFPPEIQDGLNLINDHILKILCNGVREYYEYVLDWVASRFQPEFMVKMIVVLAFYSEHKQVGKGIMFDAKPKGFLPKLLGKYYLKSLQPLNSNIGLLGQFNRGHENKLIIYLDENGEFTHAKKGNLQLESFLSAPQIQVAAKGINPVTMEDGCGIIMTSNNKMFGRAEPNGCKLFAVQCSDKYSAHYAAKGIDGMTYAKRQDYFNKLGKAMDNELVQRAFIYQMQTRDLSKYKTSSGNASSAWQSYPQTNLLKEMCCHSKCIVLEFIEAWKEHRVFIHNTELPTDLWYRPKEDFILTPAPVPEIVFQNHHNMVRNCQNSMWNVFQEWAKINNRQVNLKRDCKDKATFIDLFNKYVKSKTDKMFTSDRKGKGRKTFYQLIPDENEDEVDDSVWRERVRNAAEERQRAAERAARAAPEAEEETTSHTGQAT